MLAAHPWRSRRPDRHLYEGCVLESARQGLPKSLFTSFGGIRFGALTEFERQSASFWRSSACNDDNELRSWDPVLVLEMGGVLQNRCTGIVSAPFGKPRGTAGGVQPQQAALTNTRSGHCFKQENCLTRSTLSLPRLATAITSYSASKCTYAS